MAAAKRSGQPRKARQAQDLALVLDRTPENDGFHILRRRAPNEPLELGTIRALREGRPIDGEVVSLVPRPELPWLCDVKVELPATRPGREGPARVATEEYRRGWDAIWGRRTASSRPN